MPHPTSNRSSLWFLAITLLSFLAASTAPTPLYHLYQEHLHFSAATLTLIFGVYALSLLAALLTVGSLSDFLGRKPVIFTALLLNMLAMLLFINADSVAWLISARVLQGFATGMATAVLSAALLDTDRQQGPLVNSVAPLLGMAAGAMGCGLLAEFAPLPLQLTLGIVRAVCAASTVRLAPAGKCQSAAGCLGFAAPDLACASPGAAGLVVGAADQHRGVGARRFLRFIGAVIGADSHRLDFKPDWRRDGRSIDAHRCADDLHLAQSAGGQGVTPGRQFIAGRCRADSGRCSHRQSAAVFHRHPHRRLRFRCRFPRRGAHPGAVGLAP